VRTIVGIAVPDERPLAGRIVGWMFFAGAVLTTLLPLLPGANGEVVTPTLPIGIGAGVWGLWAALWMDWRTARGWVIHAAVMAGQLCAAVAASDTGGANSPSRFLLMLGVVFTAYFFPRREAWPYLGLVIALHALPLAYDDKAIEVMGELLLLGPIYCLLAFLLITGKHGMVEAQTRADDLARRDPLTGLANRRALLEAIGAHSGRRVGLLMLDVDDFKGINTALGHPGGDRALVAVANCLRDASREGDVAARLGGDEFAVLAPGIDPLGMSALASRLLAAIREDGTVRVSAGFVVAPAHPDQLLQEADEALAQAKGAGKDRALSYAS
jgi:diguanylate cyclase (GGDEF)-like protein